MPHSVTISHRDEKAWHGVMPIKTNNSLMVGFAVGHGNAAVVIPAIVGPLLGLAYIIVLPFVGVIAFVFVLARTLTAGLTRGIKERT